jgi:hypothetical protein
VRCYYFEFILNAYNFFTQNFDKENQIYAGSSDDFYSKIFLPKFDNVNHWLQDANKNMLILFLCDRGEFL